MQDREQCTALCGNWQRGRWVRQYAGGRIRRVLETAIGDELREVWCVWEGKAASRPRRPCSGSPSPVGAGVQRQPTDFANQGTSTAT